MTARSDPRRPPPALALAPAPPLSALPLLLLLLLLLLLQLPPPSRAEAAAGAAGGAGAIGGGCPLTCPPGYDCTAAPYVPPPSLTSSYPPDALPPFLGGGGGGGSVDSGGTWRCDCPPGYVGVECDHEYALCDDSDGDGEDEDGGGSGFACYHGAKCIDWGEAGYECDCDGIGGDIGVFYSGAHCEYEASDVCDIMDDSGDRSMFCVNGGKCIDGETDPDKVCECKDGWYGLRCEYYYDPSSSSASSSSSTATATTTTATTTTTTTELTCDFCPQGVPCAKGTADFGVIKTFPYDSPVPFLEWVGEQGLHCLCPPGFTGVECDHAYDLCDPDSDVGSMASFACFHGSKCVDLGDTDLHQWACDCSEATMGVEGDVGMFAGRHCERGASESCPGKFSDGTPRFCVNGAIDCAESDPDKVCDCQNGWSGRHCEILEEPADAGTTTTEAAAAPGPSCTLSCPDGAPCVEGDADYGAVGTFPYETPVLFLERVAEFGMHCDCPPGLTGVDCSHSYVLCDPDSDVGSAASFACFHGSECVDLGDDDLHQWACDCGSATMGLEGDEGLFAGRHCEHPASLSCGDSFPDGTPRFCVRGSINCAESDPDKLCDCRDGWSGRHCAERGGTAETAATAAPPEGSCDLPCPAGPCSTGPADFGAVGSFPYESPVPFLEMVEERNMHCECPPGLTGVTCEHAYELCDPDSDVGSTASFACFHGSECVDLGDDDLHQWACGCETAGVGDDDGDGDGVGYYAGRHCEYPSSEKCAVRLQDGRSMFCVNGGACKEGETNPDKVCECRPGWVGQHCEYLEDSSQGVVAVDDSYKAGKQSPLIRDIIANDSEAQGNRLTLVGVDADGDGIFEVVPSAFGSTFVGHMDDGSTGGVLSVLADGFVTFNSNGDFDTLGEGEEKVVTFVYTVGNKDGESDTAKVTITVVGDSCTLKCSNGGVCNHGPADYGKVGAFPYDSPPPFLDPWQIEGMHCACPAERVGPLCDHIYEFCDPEEGDFACFHNSKCINLGSKESKEWTCDCTAARWDGEKDYFAGRHCEYRPTDKCRSMDKDGLEEGRWFCVNGGECLSGETNPNKICKCHDGWTGPHCEYKEDSMAAESTEPKDCTLKCYNGGKCIFGFKDYGEHANNNQVKQMPWLEKKHSQGMHCVCPDGHTGLQCQIGAKKCGERLFCYHGSACKKAIMEDGTKRKYCDCDKINGKDDDISFAGLGCQHQSTEMCNPDTGMGMSKESAFCVNGGRCFEEGQGHLGCTCKEGFFGQHCEFHESEPSEFTEPSQCKLECKNGGKCAKGTKDFGTPSKFGDLPFLGKEHINYEHCSCPAGYNGLDCSIRLDICGESEHVCMHNGKCRPHDVKGDGTWEWRCDCEGAMDEDGMSVAGEYCQHIATEYCLGDGASATSRHSFCTNGGNCRTSIQGNQVHPGCLCKEGWNGDHCEFRVRTSSIKDTNNQNQQTKKIAILFSCMVLVIAFIIFVAAIATRWVAAQHRLEKDIISQENDRFNTEAANTSNGAGATDVEVLQDVEMI